MSHNVQECICVGCENIRKDAKRLKALRDLLNNPRVSLPDAVHSYECPAWREGKKHGPCDCGGDELSTRTRIALLAAGVKVLETPNEKESRDALTAPETEVAK